MLYINLMCISCKRPKARGNVLTCCLSTLYDVSVYLFQGQGTLAPMWSLIAAHQQITITCDSVPFLVYSAAKEIKVSVISTSGRRRIIKALESSTVKDVVNRFRKRQSKRHRKGHMSFRGKRVLLLCFYNFFLSNTVIILSTMVNFIMKRCLVHQKLTQV